MCPKCKSDEVFFNKWSPNGYHLCFNCEHEWEDRPQPEQRERLEDNILPGSW